MGKPQPLLPEIRPRADYCFGREEFLRQLLRETRRKRAALLFGGRLSGKTTILLRGRQMCEVRPESGELVLYLDCLSPPGIISPGDFWQRLLDCASRELSRTMPSKGQALLKSDSLDSFVSCLGKLLKGTSLRSLVFLLDEADRVIGKEFPDTFRDNLFHLMYGAERGCDVDVSIIFAGAQKLFSAYGLQTSPIGSRAARFVVLPLDEVSVREMILRAVPQLSRTELSKATETIRAWTDGHAGLTSDILLRWLDASKPSADNLMAVRSELMLHGAGMFRVWHESLGEAARCIHEALLHENPLQDRRVASWLDRGGQADALPHEAAFEIEFTGIGRRGSGQMFRAVPLYWDWWSRFNQPSTCVATPVEDSVHRSTISRPDKTHLVIHTNKPVIEVNGTKFDNLSLSEYALILTMADEFTLDAIDLLEKGQAISQAAVITATRATLKRLITEGWKHTQGEKSASNNVSGEWRQLSFGLRSKLETIDKGRLLLDLLPERQKKGNWVLNIRRTAVSFLPEKTVLLHK